jgi:hypothetical protein
MLVIDLLTDQVAALADPSESLRCNHEGRLYVNPQGTVIDQGQFKLQLAPTGDSLNLMIDRTPGPITIQEASQQELRGWFLIPEIFLRVGIEGQLIFVTHYFYRDGFFLTYLSKLQDVYANAPWVMSRKDVRFNATNGIYEARRSVNEIVVSSRPRIESADDLLVVGTSRHPDLWRYEVLAQSGEWRGLVAS